MSEWQHINVDERKPLWSNLSDLYLDTELQDYHYHAIALSIKESPYSFEESKLIDKQEVFPVLFYNMLSITGEWQGFDEDKLALKIVAQINNNNFFRKISLVPFYWFFKSTITANWRNIQNVYRQLP